MGSEPDENGHTAFGQPGMWAEWAHTGICHVGIADLLEAGRLLFMARLKPTGRQREGERQSLP